MELRPGYKLTEVGVIPEDWSARRLGDLCSVFRGGSPRPIQNYITDNVDGINWIKIGDVGVGAKYIDSTAEKIISAGALRSRYVKAGDFLLSNSMSFGRPYILRTEGCIHDGWLVIQDHQRAFDTEYLYYYLSTEAVLAQYTRYAAGSSVLNLNKVVVSDISVAVPPLPEQRAIAAALSDVDALLEGLERLIAKKRDLKQAAMQQLLTGQTRLPGFSGAWEVKQFDDVLARVNAKAFQIQANDYKSTGRYPVVDQGKQPIVGFSDREDLCFRCPDGGVVVFGDHTCIVKFIDFDFIVGADGTQLLCGRRGQNTRFHAYQLQFRGVEPTGYNRHFKFLKERTFISPLLKEQTAIAAVLSDMDAEIAALEARRDKSRALKQGMMQELLTGKTRLISPEVTHD